MTCATALPSFSCHGFSFVINKFFERRITTITPATAGKIAGTITVIAGSITATAEKITATAGTVTSIAGARTATAGTITATAGTITSIAGAINSNSGNNHNNSETHNSNNNDESCHFDEEDSYCGFKHQSRTKSSKSDAVSLQVKSLSNYLFNFGYDPFKRSNHGRWYSIINDFRVFNFNI